MEEKQQRVKPDEEKINAISIEMYRHNITNPSAITSIYFIRYGWGKELGRYEDVRKVVIEALQRIMSEEGKHKNK